ncbi:response regulator [Glycomyces tritici]|uniref:response regulator n=1 Tax=Glycomyces tritici TaxID=2665176 RepID=UPI00338E80D5
MIRVLVVDDEPQILRALRINLTAHGYEVATADTGTEALRKGAEVKPDLILLDLGLPDMDGREVVEGVRVWSKTPIFILSGRAASAEKIAALDAGADDYVTKPFDIGELLARVRAATRRVGPGNESPITVIGSATVDIAAKRVDREGEEIHLTRTEWQILQILLRNPGKLVSQHELLHRVWGPKYDTETHYLRQYMAQLRRKLEANPPRPVHFLTEPGMGYRFRP